MNQQQLSFDTLLQEQQATDTRIAEQDRELLEQAKQTFIRTQEQQEAVSREQQYLSLKVAHWCNTLLTPRPYQWHGADFLQDSHRAFCTFQPGLGKTETAIIALLDETGTKWRPDCLPIAIVAPSHLTEMWFDRVLKYIPTARIALVSGTRKQRDKTLLLKDKIDVFVFNYEMLHARPSTKDTRRINSKLSRAHSTRTQLTDEDYFKLMEEKRKAESTVAKPYDFPHFKSVVFDESHHLKNPDSKRAQAAAELVSSRDTQVYMLTGTPIKREPDDLYQQLHILSPHEGYNLRTQETAVEKFSSYYDFVAKYCVSLPRPGFSNGIVHPRKTAIQSLMDRWAFFTSYEEADIYRPPITPDTHGITLDPKHLDAYNMVAIHYMYEDINFHSAMEVMHALRAITACPQKVATIVEEATSYPSAVIYTCYIQSAKLIAAGIDEAQGLPTGTTPVLSGEIPVAQRTLLLKDLIDRRVPYIVGTLGTISEGHDLSYMKSVHFFEETWTPLEVEQAIDRVRRFGSTQTNVNVLYYHCHNTIDEIIHGVQDRRGITAEQIVRRLQEQWRTQYKKGKLTAP